jgi:hypothetical protein
MSGFKKARVHPKIWGKQNAECLSFKIFRHIIEKYVCKNKYNTIHGSNNFLFDLIFIINKAKKE